MPSSRAWAVLVCLVLAGTSGASAVRLRDNLFGVTALDAERAWAVGNFGAIVVTTDAGVSWRAQESGTHAPLFAVDFADATHGWVVGQGGAILRTTDAGATWTPQSSPVPGGKHLFGVAAVDARTAWAVGDWGAIATTSDGGATWRDVSLGRLVVEMPAAREDEDDLAFQPVTDDVILSDVAFVDARHGAIAGEFGTVLVTSDGGHTWRRTRTGTDKTLFGVHFATPQEGWAVGIDGIVLHTVDGGESWSLQRGVMERSDIGELSFSEAIENPGLYQVAVRDGFGVIVGDTGALLVSTDGGRSWTPRELPGKDRLIWMRDVSVVSTGTALLVGAGGFTASLRGQDILVRGGSAK